MDFISELVASTDDEDFAVLLADVECLPDEVLETLAAVLQSFAGLGVDRRDDELGQPFAAGRDVAAAVLHPDRHPCPRCDTDDDLDGAEALAAWQRTWRRPPRSRAARRNVVTGSGSGSRVSHGAERHRMPVSRLTSTRC